MNLPKKTRKREEQQEQLLLSLKHFLRLYQVEVNELLEAKLVSVCFGISNNGFVFHDSSYLLLNPSTFLASAEILELTAASFACLSQASYCFL